MAEQFNLPGFDIPSPPVPPAPPRASSQPPAQRGARLRHTLFFALFPSPEDVQRIARLAKTLRAEHGLAGNLLEAERLHVTLRDLGGYEKGVPEDVVAAAKAAAAAVSMPRIDVAFDRLLHFPASGAVVLRSGTPNAPLAALAQTLGLAVREAGFTTKPSGTAHMTLMYDYSGLPERGIEPVCWTATEFVLVHSLVGETEHVPLGRWSLRV